MWSRRRHSSSSTSGGVDSSQDQILETLHHGQSALRKLRWRIGALWLCLCGACAGAWHMLFFSPEMQDVWMYSKTSKGFWIHFFLELLFEARLMFPVLAPLDDGLSFMRFVLVGEVIFLVFICTPSFNWIDLEDQILDMAVILGFAAYVAWVMAYRRTPQKLQRALQLTVVVYSLLNILRMLWHAYMDPQLLGQVIADLLAIFMMSWPPALQSLQSLQAMLRRWMETQGATRAAAAIACLIGSAEVEEALQQARQSFKSVDVSQLTFEIFRDNIPDPRLNALAQPTKLGHCDAFISHSWHDDAAAKWEALQEWRSSFRAKHGREPSVWFDKCCIDQNNIEADLRCLPVSLGGCSSLLILYGPTYLSRLWCIIEVFTYIMMGGSIEDIDVRLVLTKAHAEEDKRTLLSAFESFEVADCQCYNPADKERIILVIGTAFGKLSAFSEVVAKVLGRIQAESLVLAEMPMTASDKSLLAQRGSS
eukprot:TRINITY_DN96527_c0_g1_i1.p1 TRINITY_DN96527_c0_g1~~TRINITY_DN96527_c0_g1_i1.p1  ORF type:complete len:479 (+),score=86.84 TRINITY_DN96527_c0_g1_i1:66-1502(+)